MMLFACWWVMRSSCTATSTSSAFFMRQIDCSVAAVLMTVGSSTCRALRRLISSWSSRFFALTATSCQHTSTARMMAFLWSGFASIAARGLLEEGSGTGASGLSKTVGSGCRG